MFCDVVLAGAYVFLWGKQRAVVYSVAYIFDARKKNVKIVSVGSCRRIYLGYCSPWWIGSVQERLTESKLEWREYAHYITLCKKHLLFFMVLEWYEGVLILILCKMHVLHTQSTEWLKWLDDSLNRLPEFFYSTGGCTLQTLWIYWFWGWTPYVLQGPKCVFSVF